MNSQLPTSSAEFTDQFGKRHTYTLNYFLKDCGTALKNAPSAAAQEPFAIIATKLEYRAMRNGPWTPPPITESPTMSKM